jgi:hypothetical protein
MPNTGPLRENCLYAICARWSPDGYRGQRARSTHSVPQHQGKDPFIAFVTIFLTVKAICYPCELLRKPLSRDSGTGPCGVGISIGAKKLACCARTEDMVVFMHNRGPMS